MLKGGGAILEIIANLRTNQEGYSSDQRKLTIFSPHLGGFGGSLYIILFNEFFEFCVFFKWLWWYSGSLEIILFNAKKFY
jgi:hypothetical protein